VLEIGCGTGALLRALAPRIEHGVGIDVSSEMLGLAHGRATDIPNLSFCVAGARLPLKDRSFDLVISFLSFRYLDWQAIWPEIQRVLAPRGRFWMVDLVGARATPRDLPRLARSAARNLLVPLRSPGFARALRELTRHPAWRAMLQRHPMRPFEEYRAFFAHAAPGHRFDVLDVTPSRRIVALDSLVPR
jgi:ubiquinone/menaquinone biosynthesis C-methylase UbiE